MNFAKEKTVRKNLMIQTTFTIKLMTKTIKNINNNLEVQYT